MFSLRLLTLEASVVVIMWFAVFSLERQYLQSASSVLITIYFLIVVFATLNSAFFLYLLLGRWKLAQSRIQLKMFPAIFRVRELPANQDIILLAPHASISIDDYGWQAEPIVPEDRVYLHGLDEDWNVVWYASFDYSQLEYVCDKPVNQYGRHSWQKNQEKCPYTVVARIPSVDSFGLPTAHIGPFVQGVRVSLKP